jgi:hypothetical protein
LTLLRLPLQESAGKRDRAIDKRLKHSFRSLVPVCSWFAI